MKKNISQKELKILRQQFLSQNKVSFFKTSDNKKLFYRFYSPTKNLNCSPQKILLCLHGLGGHSDGFEKLGEILTKQNILTLALDQRGHGLSQGKRGDIKKFKIFINDAKEFINYLIKKYQTKVYLLGESMGGIITTNYAASNNNVSGIILCSPGIKPAFNFSLSDALLLPKYLFYLIFNNKKAVIRIDNHWDLATKSKERIKEMEKDKLFLRTLTPRLGLQIAKEMTKVMSTAEKIKIPVLILQGTADKLVSPFGAKKYYKKLASSNKKISFFKGAYHGLFSDTCGDSAREVIYNWFKKY